MSLRLKMPRKSRKQVSFIAEADMEQTASLKQPGPSRISGSRNTLKRSLTSRLSRDSKYYPVSFLKRVGSEVVKVLRCECVGKKSSGMVSSDTTARSMSVSQTMDSNRHRAEAIEDCIEFLYSSSSLQRSNPEFPCTCSKP